MNGADVQWIEDAIPRPMEALKVPGCAYALIQGGRVAAQRVHGLADAPAGTPVTLETRFSLQSISKSLTAWAVMILVEEGRVDLDLPIHRYVTRWALPPSDRFDLDLVTPRRLLTHHAGVTEAGFLGVDPRHGPRSLTDALDCRLPPPNDEQKRHWAYWKLADPEPVSVTRPPGEGWNYSNPGFALLQLMVEEVSGQPLRDFISDRVMKPLGMLRSGFGREEGLPYAGPHGREGQRNIDYLWPCDAAAGAYATIGDLALFACAAMPGPDGEPPGRGVLSPEAVRAMHTPHGKADQSSLPFEAGLGHVLLRRDGLLNVHHSGGTIGWRSIFTVFPETGDGFCMLMNGEAANDLWTPIVRVWRDRVAAAVRSPD